MNPNLSKTLQYDDLNGEEASEILHTRFYDFLQTVPEFQKRFALTRLVLRFEISLDIYGGMPDRKVYQHQLTVNADAPLPDGYSEIGVRHHESDITVDSRNNPPDQVRDEHSLPVPRAIRGQAGVLETVPQDIDPDDEGKRFARPPRPIPAESIPANQPSITSRQVGRRRYAAFVDQDYGSLQAKERDGSEGPIVGAQKIAESGSSGGGSVAPVQSDFRVGSAHHMEESQAREIFQRNVQRGSDVDRVLAENRNAPDVSMMMEGSPTTEPEPAIEHVKATRPKWTPPPSNTPKPKGRK
jgi:hypothetical protein